MNEATVLKPSLEAYEHRLAKPNIDDVDRYMREGSRILDLARRRVLELEAVISKLSDELAGHQAEMARLRAIIARLEQLRDG
jgi:hypothetical protein